MDPATRNGMAEFSGQRLPGVVYGPEHGGWVGIYLPFPAHQVIDDDGLRQGKPLDNPDRAALQFLDAFVAAMRPERALLSGNECEVLEIIKAAFAAIRPQKVII